MGTGHWGLGESGLGLVNEGKEVWGISVVDFFAAEAERRGEDLMLPEFVS